MTIQLSTDYEVVHCGREDCAQVFAMSRGFYNRTRRDRTTWYCPSGHPRVWAGPTDEQQLRKAEARETALKDQLSAAIRDADNTRVALLRDRQRFANGVCPCCNRSFDNVRRHMTAKHPDYDVTKVRTSSEIRYACSCGSSFTTLRGLRIHQGHHRQPGWDAPEASRWAAHLTKVSDR